MVKAEGFVHVKREGRELHAKSAGSGPASVLASAACYYCYRIPNRESGKCLWRSIGYECTLYSYSCKERLLSTPYIVLCSTGRYSISHYVQDIFGNWSDQYVVPSYKMNEYCWTETKKKFLCISLLVLWVYLRIVLFSGGLFSLVRSCFSCLLIWFSPFQQKHQSVRSMRRNVK